MVDPVTQELRRTLAAGTEEHGSLGVLANGDDAWVNSPYDLSGSGKGNVIVEDLETGAAASGAAGSVDTHVGELPSDHP